MADLHVQPKKRNSVLPWLFIALALAALTWLVARSSNHSENGKSAADAHDAASPMAELPHHENTTVTGVWEGIDLNAPTVKYEEITRQDIEVRSNGSYSIYGLGENVLFDEGKSTIRSDAAANLKEIASSIDKRYKGGDIRVYGFTDTQGSAGSNKTLAQQRADAVKSWMESNGIAAGKISVNAIGEGQPVATNATSEGREQNRRVQIVARGHSQAANTTEANHTEMKH